MLALLSLFVVTPTHWLHRAKQGALFLPLLEHPVPVKASRTLLSNIKDKASQPHEQKCF